MASARTRNARVPIPEKALAFSKFCRLTSSGRAGVKPSSDGGGGGGQYAVLLPFANTLRFSNERPFSFRSSALVRNLVMISIFIVNIFFFRTKNFFRGPFIAFHPKGYHL